MHYPFKVIFLLLLAAALLFSGCEDNSLTTAPEDSNDPEEQVRETVDVANAQWPISRSLEPNGDISYAQYGPRNLPSGYDFHAGIDLPSPQGTPVYPVLPGEVVETDHWTGSGSGAGNAVTVKHSDTLATSYLHLHEIWVSVGDWVNSDDIVGTVGRTGASYNHLHLGYFVNLPNPNRRDERYSRNPLEILPHDDPGEIPATFRDNTQVVLDMPLQSMIVNSVELIGDGESRLADYYEIVALGWTPRKEPVQFGIHFDAERRTPDHQRFNMIIWPEGMDFMPERVILRDFDGNVVLDAERE